MALGAPSSFRHDEIAVLTRYLVAGDLPKMPSTKPELRTRVSDEVKAAFSSHAKDHALSEAHLLDVIITSYLQLTPVAELRTDSSPFEKRDELKSEEVRIRLTPFEYHELDRLAASRHWKRSTYVRQLILAHMTNEPRLCDVELAALRELTAQLTALGRHVNQITRALQSSSDKAPIASTIPFEKMKELIDQQRTCVKNLVRANLTAWGVIDGE